MKKAFLTVFLAMGFLVLCSGLAKADSIMITPSDFIVGQPGYPATIHNTHSTTLSLYTDSAYFYYFAPIHLPQDARITSVVVFYEDDDVDNIETKLERYNVYNSAAPQVMCEWTTSSNVAGWQSHKISPISLGLINNAGYVYYVEVRFTGAPAIHFDLAVRAVKIIYTM